MPVFGVIGYMSVFKLIKTIAIYLAAFIMLLVLALFYITAQDRADDYDVDSSDIVIPEFEEFTLKFMPEYNAKKTLPFTAGAIIDVDGDGIEEVFFGGGQNQNDVFYQFQKGEFKDITQSLKWSKNKEDDTFGAVSLDLDSDGDADLLVARQSGVWLYTNNRGVFSSQRLELDLDEQTVPLSVAVADLNRDGLYDMYVSGYIARKYVEGETIFNKEYGGVSALFLNQGDNQFDNITKKSGLYHQHNTFQGIFIDVDNDGLEDLVVAHDTGTVKTWKNKGNLQFEDIDNPTSHYFSYPMGIAVSDYNNDGLPDFFFSNVGSTTPNALVRGDLRDDQILNKKWIMFENKGNFSFYDVADQVSLADYEFSWGAIFEDFNLDGRDDLVVSENYVGFPTHIVPAWRLNGRFMLQNTQHEFAPMGKASGIKNRHYGISPLTADFNNDGAPDLVHTNLKGPQKIYISKNVDNHYLKIKLPNTVSSVAAKVKVTLDSGKVLHQTFIVGEGLCSDQSHTLIFGLGKEHAVLAEVTYLDGQQHRQQGMFKNQTLTINH